MVTDALDLVYVDYQNDPAFAELRMATRFVPGWGNDIDPAVMLIGEAPGRNEERTGIPFVGAAGRVLDAALAEHGIERGEDTFITNVIKYRPPGNRDPLPAEKSAAVPYLRREWQLLSPPTTVLLGRHACETVLGDREVPGTVLHKGDHRFVVTLHPAACLYRPELRDRFTRQLGMAIA